MFNAAVTLHGKGILEKHGYKLIDASFEAIQRGEDRGRFKTIVGSLTDIPGGASETIRFRVCHSLEEMVVTTGEFDYPVVMRPPFIMGEVGSRLVHDPEELRQIAGTGLAVNPATEMLIEESILGWKEYESEVARDKADNVVIVCSIESFDPMGVHTSDSVTVAPAMTLTDRGYQRTCDVGIAIIRTVGVNTGGCNIQFAINPDDGRIVVIEMNPHASRSSALASKATGFPIVKIAVKIAVGCTLNEIPNDITRVISASFEPALDHVVVKVLRFAFKKFLAADSTPTTHMKSVGEMMSIGRNFTEALGKIMCPTEIGTGFWFDQVDGNLETLLTELRCPHGGWVLRLMGVPNVGTTVEQLHGVTRIDPWFLDQIVLIQQVGAEAREADHLSLELLRHAKRHGLPDVQIGRLRGLDENVI